MMGRKDKPQSPFFYSFNLDEVVPQDHLLRKIDRILDLSDLHQHLASYYSYTGRPGLFPYGGIHAIQNHPNNYAKQNSEQVSAARSSIEHLFHSNDTPIMFLYIADSKFIIINFNTSRVTLDVCLLLSSASLSN